MSILRILAPHAQKEQTNNALATPHKVNDMNKQGAYCTSCGVECTKSCCETVGIQPNNSLGIRCKEHGSGFNIMLI